MDDFITVKKSKKRSLRRKHFAEKELVVEYINVDKSVLKNQVLEVQSQLEVSNYLTQLLKEVSDIGLSFRTIYCYGIGSFNESYISRHQLAALLLLKKHFNCKTFVYDPVFNPIEKDVLLRLGVDVLGTNDEAKQQISPADCSLIYFAHCSSQLVNNFLWANWNACLLHNCVILSNSFTKVISRNDTVTVDSLSCMRDALQITQEVPIANTYQFSDVFNDLSIHYFPSSKVTDHTFWAARPEPNYKGQTIEFCTREAVVTLRQF